MDKIKSYHAGWLFMVDFSDRKGCESRGNMPALVISTEQHNTVSQSVIVVPCTRQLKHSDWDQHVAIFAEDVEGVASPVIAMTEHVTEVDKSRLGRCIGSINSVDYDAVIDNLLTYTIRKER